MKVIFTICLLCFCGLPYVGQAQQTVTRYYDQEQQALKEQFEVAEEQPQVLNGRYTAYYANGSLQVKGHYRQNVAMGQWEYFYENGHPRMRGPLENNVYHGIWEYFYENGHLEMRGAIYDTVRQGPWQFFFEKGSLRSEGQYTDGKKEGTWKSYYEDGSLKSEEIFKGDSGTYQEFYSSGQLKLEGQRAAGRSEGRWTQYDEEGHIKATGNYVKGAQQGKWLFYYSNGQLSSTGEFLDGSSVGKWTYYHNNGKVSAEGAEKNGKKEGYWKLYHSSGDFKGEAVFNQGEGVYQEFYEDGSLKARGRMTDGVHQGKWEYFYEDGVLEGDAIFNKGKGTYHGYYRDGTLKMKGTLEQGERTGIWELYKPDGNLAGYYTSVYENDEPVFRAMEQPANRAAAESSDKKTPLSPDYLYRKTTSRYFKSRVNELKSFIVGVNPLGLLLNRLPLSVEYYMQERLGYELEIGYEHKPFFTAAGNMAVNTPYSSGFFLAVKQKFYHNDTRSGMFYFGHRLGFDYVQYRAHVGQPYLPETHEHMRLGNGQRVSYAILGGTRLMKDADLINTRLSKDTRNNGLTFDLYVGIGLGYRFFQQRSVGAIDGGTVPAVPASGFYFPLQIGATIGYVF